MAYIKEHGHKPPTVYPHKLRSMLKGKVSDLLSRYTLDEVLSEIASQRPSFDIHLHLAPASPKPNGSGEEQHPHIEAE